MVDHRLRRAVLGAAFTCITFAVTFNPARAEAQPAATELVRLQGQAVELRRIAADDTQGAVVFENGSRISLDSWDAVFNAMSATPSKGWSLMAYNRPGVGRSEATERPRDGKQVVADLRELLQQQGIKPPYVLVGHSLGGLYMQLFARLHPDEVRGLVLVDALYPGVIKKPEEFPFYARWGKAMFLNRMVGLEIDQVNATGEVVLGLPWPQQIPVARLVNVPKSKGAVAVDFGVVNDDAATIARVRALYPGAKTVVVDSDHQLQTATPEVVVQAIQDMINPR